MIEALGAISRIADILKDPEQLQVALSPGTKLLGEIYQGIQTLHSDLERLNRNLERTLEAQEGKVNNDSGSPTAST